MEILLAESNNSPSEVQSSVGNSPPANCDVSVAPRTLYDDQLELDFLLALNNLHVVENTMDTDTNDDRDKTKLREQLRWRYEVAREAYKTQVWEQEFELVLRMISEETKKSFATDVLRQREIQYDKCRKVERAEGTTLRILLEDFERILKALRDATLVLRSSSSGISCTEPGLAAAVDVNDTLDHQELKEALAGRDELLAKTSGDDNGEQNSLYLKIDAGTHCNGALGSSHVQAEPNIGDTYKDLDASLPSSPAPTEGRAATDQITAAQMRLEHEALRAAMDRERALFDAKCARVRRRNEEDLARAAEMLKEAVEVQAQTERVLAATRVDLAAAGKIREMARRRAVS